MLCRFVSSDFVTWKLPLRGRRGCSLKCSSTWGVNSVYGVHEHNFHALSTTVMIVWIRHRPWVDGLPSSAFMVGSDSATAPSR